MTSEAKKRWREFLAQNSSMSCVNCPVTFVEQTTDMHAYSETECPELFLHFVKHSSIRDKEILLEDLKYFFDDEDYQDDGEFSCTGMTDMRLLEMCKPYQYFKEDMETE